MKAMSVRKLVFSAAVAAIYAALTVALAPISYGEVQFRVSEALCILPFFFPCTAWGLFAGCLIANLMSPVGILDIVFGSLATLLAGLCTAAVGRMGRSLVHCVLACLMPVVFNAVIVGAVLAWSATGLLFSGAGAAAFGIIALEVGFGELVVLFVIGLPLMRVLLGREFFRRMGERLGA